MKQIEATILGQSYMLACPPDGEQLLQHAVAIVDREMSAIRDAGKVKARERIAVLTALNLAYQRAEQSRAASQSPATRAAAPGRQASSGSDAPAQAGPSESPAAADIARLMARIDRALGDDGLLL